MELGQIRKLSDWRLEIARLCALWRCDRRTRFLIEMEIGRRALKRQFRRYGVTKGYKATTRKPPSC